jgi:hypothetical protein
MASFVHALDVFVEHLASISLASLALALVCHVAKVACRSRAWCNILAAAYPGLPVRQRDIFGATLAGVGVNAVVPARGGDVVKLYLAKRSIPGATYPTLVSTCVVETLFDVLASATLLVWAIQQGVLPGLDVLPNLPAFDLRWILEHPLATAAIATALAAVLAYAGWRATRHVVAFWRRVAQGFAVLGDWKLYLRSVATWQAADWCFRTLGLVFFLEAFGIGVGLHPLERLHDALLVQVTQSLSTLLPLTPGGIGTEQALVVYVFAGEVPTTALVSFSVGMKLILTAVNVALGFAAIALMLRTLRWRRHMRRAEGAAISVGSPVALAEPARRRESL